MIQKRDVSPESCKVLCDIPEGIIEKCGDRLFLYSDNTEWMLSGHYYEPCIYCKNTDKQLDFVIHNAEVWFPEPDADASEWELLCRYITKRIACRNDAMP